MRTFAFSDLHGQRNLWEQIKAFLQPDDIVYFLGDAIDRGPDGYEIMKELLHDPRIVYIKGNHELMMQEALEEIRQNDGALYGERFYIWSMNGCQPTLDAWVNNGSFYEWIDILRELPTEATYTNAEGREVVLCHAGFTPDAKPMLVDEMVWDRRHFRNAIPEEYQDGHMVIVHGHTPTPYLIMDLDEFNAQDVWNGREPRGEYQEKDGVVVYADGVKIDIDCGCFFTGEISILNLDTWETIHFSEGE